MWPKALLELLPHLTRLVPLANRYFDSKSAGDDATRVALERKLGETAAALRVDIQRGAEAGEALQAQLSRQTATLNEVAAGVEALKASDEAIEARLTKLEERVGRQGPLLTLLVAVVVLQVVAIAILIVLLVMSRHR